MVSRPRLPIAPKAALSSDQGCCGVGELGRPAFAPSEPPCALYSESIGCDQEAGSVSAGSKIAQPQTGRSLRSVAQAVSSSDDRLDQLTSPHNPIGIGTGLIA